MLRSIAVAIRFFYVKIIDRKANECYYILLVMTNRIRWQYVKYSVENE